MAEFEGKILELESERNALEEHSVAQQQKEKELQEVRNGGMMCSEAKLIRCRP
jgi:hypothetical protein